jgi:hypothetical protein
MHSDAFTFCILAIEPLEAFHSQAFTLKRSAPMLAKGALLIF